jgi:hypothetical protein
MLLNSKGATETHEDVYGQQYTYDSRDENFWADREDDGE